MYTKYLGLRNFKKLYKMGILGLMKLISDVAPGSIKENQVKNYFGRKIAIDASMSLYQFLIAVRTEGSQLTSTDGETTSHLMGIFYRTIRLVENGIKPVYVFDGKPPNLKSSELDKRAERREEAQKALAKAEEAGDTEQVEKFTRRLVKVTKEHAQECKELLKLMGIPYIDAPCEAEAQCAALVKAGKVYATATEDMDALTFGSNILLRHVTFSEARKLPIQEINLGKLLSDLELNQEEFIDLCILLGCDYCESIRGIGPKRAIELIKKHKNLETILSKLDKKYLPPENWLFKEARQLFLTPEVADPDTIQKFKICPGKTISNLHWVVICANEFQHSLMRQEIFIKWSEPDVEGLVKFLCGDKMFNEERVRNGAKKLAKARTGQTQGRIDTFVKVLPSTANPKRKAEDKAKSNKKPKVAPGKRGKK